MVPLISVIVPTKRGTLYLPTCLDALRRQSHPSFEVLVVDDGSTDGTRSLLAERYPEMRVLRHEHSLGFVRSINDGIRASTSPIVALLNDDTEADEHWLAELCRPFDEDPRIGLCASKLLLFDRRDTIHSAGDFYGLDGVPGNRGVWQVDRGQFDHSEDVFGACGGAAAYRRAMLDDIGLFDEDLWMYCEDVDLSFRALNAGYRCRFVPAARVYHRLSASGGGTLASYYCGRNFVLVAAANYPGLLFRRYWPRIVAAQVRYLIQSLRHAREPAARARLGGQIAGLLGLPRALAKRRRRPRRVPISDLERSLSARPGSIGGRAD